MTEDRRQKTEDRLQTADCSLKTEKDRQKIKIGSSEGFFLFLLLLVCSLQSAVCGPADAAEKPKIVAAADWQTHFNQGVDFGRRGDWDKAIEKFKTAEKLKPGRAEIYTDLALAYAEKKDFANSAAYAEKAVKTDPSQASGYLALGIAQEGLAKPEDALKAYRDGVALDQKNPEIHFLLKLYSFRKHTRKHELCTTRYLIRSVSFE